MHFSISPHPFQSDEIIRNVPLQMHNILKPCPKRRFCGNFSPRNGSFLASYKVRGTLHPSKFITTNAKWKRWVDIFLHIKQEVPETIYVQLSYHLLIDNIISGVSWKYWRILVSFIHPQIQTLLGEKIISILTYSLQCSFRYAVAFFKENQPVQLFQKIFSAGLIKIEILMFPQKLVHEVYMSSHGIPVTIKIWERVDT